MGDLDVLEVPAASSFRLEVYSLVRCCILYVVHSALLFPLNDGENGVGIGALSRPLGTGARKVAHTALLRARNTTKFSTTIPGPVKSPSAQLLHSFSKQQFTNPHTSTLKMEATRISETSPKLRTILRCNSAGTELASVSNHC